MIDFHTHTILSDGALIPSEQIRQAEYRGYRVLGIADHVDLAILKTVLPQVMAAARLENALGNMTVLAGAEFTHVRPVHIATGVHRARELGADFVIVHGETIVEPVEEGTNRAAIEAGADILAHPGLISDEDAALAAERGVRLEISGKPGHSLTNGHVAATARKHGAKLLFGSDSHGPSQFVKREKAEQVCRAAGLSPREVADMFEAAEAFAMELRERSRNQ